MMLHAQCVPNYVLRLQPGLLKTFNCAASTCSSGEGTLNENLAIDPSCERISRRRGGRLRSRHLRHTTRPNADELAENRFAFMGGICSMTNASEWLFCLRVHLHFELSFAKGESSSCTESCCSLTSSASLRALRRLRSEAEPGE